MGEVIKFPGLEGFEQEPWQFLVEEYGDDGGRKRTHIEDPQVIIVTAEFADDSRYFVAEIVRVDGDRWRWEVESRTGEIESGDVGTLATAVATAQASAIRRFRAGRNHFVAA